MANWSPIPPTRKERVANTGNAITVSGGDTKAIATYGTGKSEALSLYVQCVNMQVPADLFGSADYRLMVTCDWGHGNASNKTDFDCTFRQRIPLVGSSVELSCWIAAFPFFNSTVLAGSGGPPIGPFTQGGLGGANGPLQAPTSVEATARLFIGGGTDSVSLFPTFWLTQQDVALGQYLVGQGRLATFKYWVEVDDDYHDPGPYIQLFDKAALPVPGDIPFDSSPAFEAEDEQRLLVQGQTRGLVNGLAWALSSSPFAYEPPFGVAAFTTAEFEE